MIVLSNPTGTSSGLAVAARDRLRAVPYPAVGRVSCEDRLGRLVLRGRLPSFYLKQLAQEAVARLEGVLEVVNEVEVVEDAGSSPHRPEEF